MSVKPEDHKPPQSRLVVSNRWDGLGARLTSLANAWSLAQALGVEFRFVWPHRPEAMPDAPLDLFSQSFREAFEIAASDIADREAISAARLRGLSLSDACQFLLSAGGNTVVEVSEPFDVCAFAGEGSKLAGNRFREAFCRIGWSDAARDVVDFISNWRNPDDCSAIHVRAGDIVVGAWRNFIAHEKYVPTPLVSLAIETLSGADRKLVVVISDNQAYVEYLKQRFRTVRTPRDILPGYDALSELQQALADILLLSRCREIVGPPRSAFTGLAANLSAQEVRRPASTMAEDEMGEFVLAEIERGMREAAHFECLKPLLARDICWYLDVFGELLPRDAQMALARRALDLEPNFCCALTRFARAASLAGKHGEADQAGRRALGIARSVSTHADPSVESLATIIAGDCLALADQSRLPVAGSIPALRKLYRRVRNRWALRRLRRDLKLCGSLRPYQMDFSGIVQNLSFQIEAAAWLSACGTGKFVAAGEPLASSKFRRGGLQSYRSDPIFDAVLRHLERVSLLLSGRIGQTIFDLGEHRETVATGRIKKISVSSSGLNWIRGSASRGSTAVGLEGDRQAAYGGPRNDAGGFTFPVPSDAVDVHGRPIAKLYALTRSGKLRRVRD